MGHRQDILTIQPEKLPRHHAPTRMSYNRTTAPPHHRTHRTHQPSHPPTIHPVQVTVIDNLANSKLEGLRRVAKLTGMGRYLHFKRINVSDVGSLSEFLGMVRRPTTIDIRLAYTRPTPTHGHGRLPTEPRFEPRSSYLRCAAHSFCSDRPHSQSIAHCPPPITSRCPPPITLDPQV